MTEQEALDAFFDEWHKQANEAGESLTQPQRDCAEEAWYAGIAWLRSQGEPVGVVRNCSANGLRVSIMDAGLYAGQYLYAAPQPAIPDGWSFEATASGNIIVHKSGIGGYVASKNARSIASEILHALASDLLAAAPEPK